VALRAPVATTAIEAILQPRMPRLNPHSVRFTLLLASLVTLASFATDMGLPVLAETAASLGVSPATVKREWAVARAWLRRELGAA